MITDPDIRDQAYQYFLEEAPDLLQTIEEDIFAINEGSLDPKDRPLRVNSLMRATHTLKGGAANVGLETIKTVAHSMEDVFKALYNPELEIDAETKRLIYESYECLREPLTAEFSQVPIDRDAILDRAAVVFAQLQDIFGDYLTDQDAFPTSEELGLDVVESFFQAVIPERLQELHTALASHTDSEIVEVLRSQAEIFLGLAESLGLPGFGEIAQTIITALDFNGDRVVEIAQAAIANIEQAQKKVLEGERERGGEPSPELLLLAKTDTSQQTRVSQATDFDLEMLESMSQALEELQIQEDATSATLIETSNNREISESKFAQDDEIQTQILSSQEGIENQEEQEQQAVDLIIDLQDELPTQSVSRLESWDNQKLPDPSLTIPAESIEDQEEELFALSATDLQLLDESSQAGEIEQDNLDDSFTVIDIDTTEDDMSSVVSNQPLPSLNITSPSQDSPQGKQLLQEIWGDQRSQSNQTTHPTNKNYSSTNSEIVDSSEQDSESNSQIFASNQAQSKKSDLSNYNPSKEIQNKSTLQSSSITPTEVNNVVESPSSRSKLASPGRQNKNHKNSGNQTVRVNLESLERLNDLVGELLINQNQNILKDENIYQFVQQLISKINHNELIINNLIDIVDEVYISPEQDVLRKEIPEKLSKIVGKLSNKDLSLLQEEQLLQSTLNLENEKTIDQLLQLILQNNSELGTIADRIKNYNKQSQRDTQKQQRMLLNMRDELIETRMSPIGRVFNRFPRMLQQLSSTYNKKVELKIVGGHILIDKTVEEKLYDPLLHLIRNAFDHGLESPEVRVQNGKLETGNIELRAYYQGGKTIIEIKDDGKGLNLEKIKNRAIEKKLITPNEANNLAASRLLEFLFEPGFSTADKVSSLSGRGVGLDVVRSQIEGMDGHVSIESTPNKGTVFSLQIPLTLTIAKLMLTKASGIIYALLIDAIERIVVPISNQIRVFEGQKVLHWQTENDTQIIPVRKLSQIIEYPRTITGKVDSPENLYNPIILLRRQGGLVGLEVDQVLGEQELVIRPLGSAIAPPKYVYGCSVLKDSRLTLVIDGTVLLKQNQYTPSAVKNSYLPTPSFQALPSASSASEQPLLPESSVLAQTLLVVDDSSSLRQSIAMSLQKVSGEVIQAENGLKALEKLQKSGNVNLVVCDLEMPMMNGFQFLKALRQNQNLRDTPVIILTSRDSDKHRKLALQLGAAAYLIKPCDEQELFDHINRIINRK